MLRLVVFPPIVILSGLAPLYQWRESRWRACAGWFSSDMDEHWKRLYRERTGHAARNIMAEWVRLDPQRAGKLFSLLLLISLLGNLWQLLAQ